MILVNNFTFRILKWARLQHTWLKRAAHRQALSKPEMIMIIWIRCVGIGEALKQAGHGCWGTGLPYRCANKSATVLPNNTIMFGFFFFYLEGCIPTYCPKTAEIGQPSSCPFSLLAATHNTDSNDQLISSLEQTRLFESGALLRGELQNR